MKRSAAIAVIGLLFLVGPAWSSEVTNIAISYQDGATVARIDIKGPVRFTHETEVPKNGRPDRVIVDVLSATHKLGAKEFLSLPRCVITGVRTSQYAVTPEKIVRIVFDLSKNPLYRIDSDTKSITIFFGHKGVKAFPEWSTAAVVAAPKKKQPALAVKPPEPTTRKASVVKATRVVAQNKAIEADRMASLGGEPEKQKSPEVAKPTSEPKKAPVKTSDRRFSAQTYSDRPIQAKPKTAETKATTPVQKVTSPKPVILAVADQPKTTKAPKKDGAPAVEPTKKVTAKVEAKPESPRTAPESVTKKESKKVAPPPVSKAPVKAKLADAAPVEKPVAEVLTSIEKVKPLVEKKVVAQTAKPAAKPTKVAVKPKAKTPPKTTLAKTSKSSKNQQALAKKVASTSSGKSSKSKTKSKKSASVASTNASKPAADPKPRSTARFRRKASSTKIQGTMVAEFPKRLVIKYKSGGRRDPFGGLLDASRTFNDPIGTRIPNVEGLKLVGIIESVGDANRALFEDKAGFSYMLKGGDKVRNGYVLRVEADQVYFQVFEYGWSRTVALTME